MQKRVRIVFKRSRISTRDQNFTICAIENAKTNNFSSSEKVQHYYYCVGFAKVITKTKMRKKTGDRRNAALY